MAKGSGHIGRKVATAASILLIAAGIALAGGVARMNDRADNVPASPRGVAADDAGGIECPWDFEEIDWEGWESENPDVIGWVQVPGTDISLPVAAARRGGSRFLPAPRRVRRLGTSQGCRTWTPSARATSTAVSP